MEVLHETHQDLQALDLKGEFGDCIPPVQNDDTPPPDFGGGGGGEKRENTEIWLGPADVSTGGDVDGDHSLFYAAEDFPPLPEFPCMSSSSSNSSTSPTTATATATAGGFSSSGATPVCSSSSSSSSLAASWAVLKSDAEASDEYHHHHYHQSVQPDQQSDHHRYDNRTEGSELRGIDEMDVVADCINVMEDFDCMGINQLIEDSNEIWDPTPLFESPDQIAQNPFEQFQQQIGEFGISSEAELHPLDQDDQEFLFLDDQTPTADGDAPSDQDKTVAEDLAGVFFEWLKSNKEAISAEELRSIKIKKSTIESAARRLGGGKEGTKQLLKLILQWVQHRRLQNKRSQGESAFSDLPDPNPNPNPIQLEQPPCFNLQPPPWINPYVKDPSAAPAPAPAPPPSAGPGFASMMSYIGGHDHHPCGAHQPYNHALLPPDQYHMLDSSMSTPWGGQLAPHPASFAPWPPPSAPMHYKTGPDGCLLQAMAPQGFAGYSNQYNPYQFFPGPGDGLVRNMGSSATKEARKKRMARQRRLFTHHHRGHNNTSQHHGNGGQHLIIQGGGLDPDGRLMIGDHDSTGLISHGGWVYWPPAAGVAAPPMMGSMQLPLQQLQPQQPAVAERPGVALSKGSQRQAAADKKQGFKTEKNLKFLLQKVLKQSDVGSLGRIVLPKKEAETHLPELEARDGIPIAMEDICTSRVWNMRYRFWPNNKSRMYLLENTGDFVRSNGLQEGDFIVIYLDVKCGKYMIRGVKVRPQQQGSKSETKKPSNKAQKTQSSGSPAGSALSPLSHKGSEFETLTNTITNGKGKRASTRPPKVIQLTIAPF